MPTPQSTRLTLVWRGKRLPTIESVSIRRRVLRISSTGDERIVDTDISLPRVRFLEAPDDPMSPIGPPDMPAPTEEDAMPLAA